MKLLDKIISFVFKIKIIYKYKDIWKGSQNSQSYSLFDLGYFLPILCSVTSLGKQIETVSNLSFLSCYLNNGTTDSNCRA